MAKITVLPDQATIDGFKGTIDFYVYNGVQCVRRWPVSSPRKPSASEAEAQRVFAAAVALWSALPKVIRDEYRRWSSASSLSSRDLFIKGYIGGIYRYPKELCMLPSAGVYLSANLVNLVDSSPTKVPFDTEDYDFGGNFDTVNNRFIAPRAGRYLITASLHWINLVSDRNYIVSIYVNGVFKRGNSAHASMLSALNSTICDILNLSRNDFVEIYATSYAGVDTVDIAGWNLPDWTRAEFSLLQ